MTTPRLRITVVGGGSYFTPSFIGTMCARPDVFAEAEVRLNDFDSGRVALVQQFCEKFARARGVPMTFIPQSDLDRSLDGADYVIETFRVGGVKSLILDESIPPRYGYLGDETVGPGGLFMAMRTIPVALDVAARMRRLCPDAWLLNYANPTHMIADALRRRGYERSVGLCDGYICPPADVGLFFGLQREDVETRHAGINHCAWTWKAKARKDGRDLLKALREDDRGAMMKHLSGLAPYTATRVMRWLEIFDIAGLFPAPAGHMEPYFFHHEVLDHQMLNPRSYHTYSTASAEANWGRLRAVLADWDLAAAEQVAKAHQGAHADLAIGVLAAIATDSGEEFSVNVPHGGAVPGFDPQTILELYCRVGRNGFEPQSVPAFPQYCQAQQRNLLEVLDLVVSGILEKDRQRLVQAFCLHPFTQSVARARTLFEAMWTEEREVLGSYWDGV